MAPHTIIKSIKLIYQELMGSLEAFWEENEEATVLFIILIILINLIGNF